VTFGGGITTQKGSLEVSPLLKKPLFFQCVYNPFSMDLN
jgi:hypothetical protein